MSMSLGLFGQASNMVEIKVDVAKKALYVMGTLGFVQDLRKELEDSADSIAAILPTYVSAGHGDHDRTVFQVNIINILIL